MATRSMSCDTALEARWDGTVELLRRAHLKQQRYVGACPDDQGQGSWRQPDMVPVVVGSKCEPWWRRDVVELVGSLLGPQMVGVEFGGGSSSIWLVQRLAFLHTVDHAPEWRDYMLAKVNKYAEPSRFRLHVVDRGSCPGNRCRDPTAGDRYAGVEFGLANRSVDVVVVDGRHRGKCLKRALALLKPVGGILIFDNSDRATSNYISGLEAVPDHWRRFDSFAPWPRDGTIDESIRANVNFWITRDNLKTTVFVSRLESCPYRPPDTALRTDRYTARYMAYQHPGASPRALAIITSRARQDGSQCRDAPGWRTGNGINCDTIKPFRTCSMLSKPDAVPAYYACCRCGRTDVQLNTSAISRPAAQRPPAHLTAGGRLQQ